MSKKENIEPQDPGRSSEPEEQSQPVPGFDDTLADARQALIEDDVEEQAKDPGFLGRLKKRLKPKKQKGTPVASESIDKLIPLDKDIELLAEDELEEASQALMAMLHSEQEMVQEDVDDEPAEDETPEPVSEATTESHPEPPVSEPAEPETESRKSESDADIQEIRDVALEDYDETQDTRPKKSALSSLSSFFTGFTRAEKMIITGMFFVAVSVAIFYGAFYLGRSTAPTPPAPEPTLDILKPRPVSVVLPGNLSFRLTTGLVKDGKWEPTGPEWLKGTEICRWVSLPWSTQLEAAIRTINAGDIITLGMSNADKLTYTVKSLTQVSADEMDKLPSSQPCLLIILTNPNETNRWVLEAVPE